MALRGHREARAQMVPNNPNRRVYPVWAKYSIPMLSTLVAMTLFSGCLLHGPGGFAVVGTLRDASTDEPLSGTEVVVRALVSGDEELGRGSSVSDADGRFSALVLTLCEAPSARQLEVIVMRAECTHAVVLDAGTDTSTEVPFGGPVVLNVSDPILVPPCEAEGDGAP